VDGGAAEPVRDDRTRRTTARVTPPEPKAIDDKLITLPQQPGERLWTPHRLGAALLVVTHPQPLPARPPQPTPHPRQRLPHRDQHQHQPDTRADTAAPELESGAHALAAAATELLLERREFVDTGCDRTRAGHEGAVRSVQPVHGDAHESPDGEVRADEERHG